MSMQHKFLVFGPMAKENELQGGLTVSFNIFLEQLKKNKIDFEVINTNKVKYKFKFLALLYIYWLFFFKVRKSTHICLHGSDQDYIYLAPVVVLVSKVLGKTVSLRKFAGSFLEVFESLSPYKKVLVKYALSNANINFFQTKYLVEYFKQFNTNTFWFPTVRNKSSQSVAVNKRYTKKFIFLGHIRSEKGIDQILEVASQLDDSYHIDLYGSIAESKYNTIDWKKYKNISYNGTLKPSEVYDILAEHDVLLLPTYWKGEGYPGVIIESLALGLPVIATNLRGISEILNDRSGILVEAKNVDQLKEAILFFNDINYVDFSKSALESFNQFDAELKIREIIDQVNVTMLSNE